MTWTKEQKKEYMKEWRKKNKEQKKEYMKQYREKNKEKIKEYRKQYREKNKQHIKEYKQTGKGLKINRISAWKTNGLNETKEFIDQIYEEYINSEECQLCGETYSKQNIKQMEHCHITGKFRNIVCKRCNEWKADRSANNICYDDKRKDYRIHLKREGKYIVNTRRKTKEDALKLLEETKLKYPHYFT